MYKCWKVEYKYADYWWNILFVTLKPSVNLDLTFPVNISNVIKHIWLDIVLNDRPIIAVKMGF
jgi:hypothetical protein